MRLDIFTMREEPTTEIISRLDVSDLSETIASILRRVKAEATSVAPCRQRLIFRGGLVDEDMTLKACGFSNPNANYTAYLARNHNLARLSMQGNVQLGPGGIREFRQSLGENKLGVVLGELRLANCGLRGAGTGQLLAQILNDMEALAVLDVSDSRTLCWQGLDAFAQELQAACCLRELHVRNCDLRAEAAGEAIALLLQKCSLLRSLDLRDNVCLKHEALQALVEALTPEGVEADDPSAIAEAPSAPELQSIEDEPGAEDPSGSGMEEELGEEGEAKDDTAEPPPPPPPEPEWEESVAAATLEELNLANCGLAGVAGGLSTAGVLRKLKGLRVFSVQGNSGLGAVGLRSLAANLPKAGALQELDISGCGLCSAEGGSEAIVGLVQRAHGLQVLRVGKQHLGMQGLQTLGELLPAGLPLLSLELSRCGIDSHSGQSLATLLRNFPQLSALSLEDNSSFGNEGLRAFAEHLPDGCVLRELFLPGCGLSGHDGGQALASLLSRAQRLSVLDVSYNSGLGVEAAEALAGAIEGASSSTGVAGDVTRLLPDFAPRENPAGQPYVWKQSPEDRMTKGSTNLLDLPAGLVARTPLRELRLSGCRLAGAAGGKTLARIAKADHIEILDISRNPELGPDGILSFADAVSTDHFVGMKVFDISCCGLALASASMSAPSPSTSPKASKTGGADAVFLQETDHPGAEAITFVLRALSGLERLNISDQSLGVAGLRRMLQTLPEGHGLKELVMQRCALAGVDSGRLLGAMLSTSLPCLERLDLQGNEDFGSFALTELVAKLPDPMLSLQDVNLKCCGLLGSDAGEALAALLRKALNLETLVIAGNLQLRTAGFTSFVEALPMCSTLCNVVLDEINLVPKSGSQIADLCRMLSR